VVALHVKTAVIFCGMPGSGKSIGLTVASDLDIPVIVMGDVVREEVACRKLQPSPQSLGQIMLELREQYGPAVVAERCIEKLQHVASPHVVIDGARSEAEISAFRRVIDHVKVIAVHTSPKIRFARLQERGRADDALTEETFHERDARELDIGIGRVIAQADIVIINEGNPEELKAKALRILNAEFNLD
jgi:dephospho-CoA kinase